MTLCAHLFDLIDAAAVSRTRDKVLPILAKCKQFAFRRLHLPKTTCTRHNEWPKGVGMDVEHIQLLSSFAKTPLDELEQGQ